MKSAVRNEHNPLELEEILQAKDIKTLQKLLLILTTKSSSNDKEEQKEQKLEFQDQDPQLSDFFAYRKKTTSISDNDDIFLEVLIKVLNDKKSNHTNALQDTDNGDDEIYDPEQDSQLHYQHLQQQANENDRSNHISWKQSKQEYPIDSQNKQTTTIDVTSHNIFPSTLLTQQKFALLSQEKAILILINKLQAMQNNINTFVQLQLPPYVLPLNPSLVIPTLNQKLLVIRQLLLQIDYPQLIYQPCVMLQNTAIMPLVNGSTLSQKSINYNTKSVQRIMKLGSRKYTIESVSYLRATGDECISLKDALTVEGFVKLYCSSFVPQVIRDLVLVYYAETYGLPGTASKSWHKFKPKFNNHGKGNFYISKEMIHEMMYHAIEPFNTDIQNDEKLAFGYFAESVAMSINDGQINDIFQTSDGELMIIINIDLTCKGGETMYLIAMENDPCYRERVRWCIVGNRIQFMSAREIYDEFGITNDDLPKSSRNMRWFKDGMNRAPVNLSQNEIDRILTNVNFQRLPRKTSKRRRKANNRGVPKSRISQQNLRYYVEESLKDDSLPIVPVVVIKGNKQWIEWKRFVGIYDHNEHRQYIGISLKYHEANKQWRIECLEYDSGRLYYQHRLTSLPNNDHRSYSYNIISQCITTILDIYGYNKSD